MICLQPESRPGSLARINPLLYLWCSFLSIFHPQTSTLLLGYKSHFSLLCLGLNSLFLSCTARPHCSSSIPIEIVLNEVCLFHFNKCQDNYFKILLLDILRNKRVISPIYQPAYHLKQFICSNGNLTFFYLPLSNFLAFEKLISSTIMLL